MSNYDDWKANDYEGEAWAAEQIAIGALLVELENDPDELRAALGSYGHEDYERLDELEIKAHLSDSDEDWGALTAERKRLMAAALLAKAKAHVIDKTLRRRGQTADLFANRLSNDEE